MRCFADPEEGLAFAHINYAVAALAFLPALAGHHLARELADRVALQQVLDLEDEADLLAGTLVCEVVRNGVGELEGHSDRLDLLGGDGLSPALTLGSRRYVAHAATDSPLGEDLLGLQDVASNLGQLLLLLQ